MSEDFNKLKPFRFWCQKVLPLVYDNSLSYYELLCKVVDYLNKTMEDVNSVIDLTESFTTEQSAAYAAFTAGINATVASLTASFNTLQSFVDNYFDNLDVQDEINTKLDLMASDGTLSDMVRPVAAGMIPGLVAQWLNEHITPTSPPVDKTLTVSNAAADSKVVGTNFDDLKQRMSLEEEWEIPITHEDLIQGGYNSDGSLNQDGTNYLRTPQMIPIYPGMSMHFKGGAVIDRMKAGYFDLVTRRYDASKDIAWFTGERTVTFDMYGLIIPLFRRASNTEVIPTDFDAEFELISETKTRIETRVLYKNSGETGSGDIGSGTGLECGYSIQPRKNLVITFSGKIPTGSTFANLEIGLKSGSTKYNNLVIDSQNVTFTTMVNTVDTKPHGLTITKNIQVSIKTILENKAIVRITSNGSSVDLEFTPYQQWRIASAYAETSGSLTLCTLSCINQDIAKPIWYFGDSYTAYASNRWPYYADKWVNNILLDGYGGETSNYVITAFETYLTSGYPQYAVFATGMNDGSDTDANTPNADWLSAVEEFIEICEDNQIIPVLCTVPTTPVYNNNGKNVYVRTSGYWYIDFAKAVGADGTGAWYTGMLGTDNIHPTVAGAKALCAQIEADFPEVFIQGVETDRSLTRYGVPADAGEVGERFDDLDEIAPYVIGKNKYNPEDCNPQNGYYYDTSGAIKEAALYAITGKIPALPNTAYTFSATAFSTQYLRPYYFSGESGEIFISREENTGVTTFTTPAECTFVAFNLFGRSHTEEDFANAIAVAQLELGSIATTYEPYTKTRKISPENIVGGDALEAVNDVTKTQSQINLYDKTLAMDGKYFNGSSSAVLDSADWAYTGKIPVEPNRQYCISRDVLTPLVLSSAVYCFDAYGNRLANASLGNYVYNYLLSFTTPDNCKFVSCNMNLNGHTAQDFTDTIDTLMVCEGTQRPLNYVAYSPEFVVDTEKLSDAYVANRDCFTGKRWLAIGTSITWYDSKTYQAGVNSGEICRGYVGNVARRKKLLVTNEGISGSTLANISESSLINRYQDLDWANADICTIEFGVNDFGHAVDIGTAEDPAGNTTFASCLKTVIEYALTQNPKLCLVICTEPDVRGNTANAGGHYLYEYTDVTLAIAKQYRLPVCDWYYHSGINAVTKGSSSVDYLTADGTHPNDDGHMRMGAMLNQLFDSLIC